MPWGIVALLAGVLVGNPVAAQQPADGRLKAVLDSKTLKLGYRTDSRPFAFHDAQGKPTGYTVELCQRIAQSIEKQLNVALQIRYVQVDARTRFESIVSGAADMECGSTTMSLSRMKLVDFSNVVFAESTGVLVRSGAGIFNFEALGGRKIGVIAGSTNAQAIRDQLARRRLEATLVEFRDREDGVASLGRGDIDGFATDKVVLTALAQAANRRDLILLPEDLSFEPFAIMLPRGDWAFRLAVNTGLAQVFRSGEVLELYTKYFSGVSRGQSSWVGAVFVFGSLPE